MPDTSEIVTGAERLRLKIAVLMRYRHISAFIEEAEHAGVAKRAAIYTHLNGDKWPRHAEIVRQYEEILKVPVGWIASGAGESLEQLQEALSALLNKDKENPVLRNIPPRAINQAAKHTDTEYGNSSEIRHIPILSGADLTALVSGRKMYSQLLERRTWPIPVDEAAGPEQLFIWPIPEHDQSMAGLVAPSFPAGSKLLIDRQRQILPGDFLLIRLHHWDEDQWIVRRYKAAMPYSKTVEAFTLEALNPSFEPIRITSPEKWVVGGRIMSVTVTL